MRLIWIVLIGVAAGCRGETHASAGDDGAAAASPQAAGWFARTPTGVSVRVRPAPAQPRVGPLRLRIAVADSAVAVDPLTVDLASPTMPMHGVARVAATRIERGVYAVEVEIPMEGRWALYVNLDEGEDAAVFAFDVPAPDPRNAPRDSGGGTDAEPHHAGAGQER